MASNSLDEELEIRELINQNKWGTLYRIERVVLEGIHGKAKYIVHYSDLTRGALIADLDEIKKRGIQSFRYLGMKYLLYKADLLKQMSEKNTMETEVFRLITFDTTKCYSFALKTRTEGKWPHEKHFTTNPLQYLGYYKSSARWGYGDQSGGSETFEHDGKLTTIIYDYEGRTCFTIM
jgi:hypothetical protein